MGETALIGYGYWGKNVFRNLIKIIGIENTIIVDNNKKKIDELKSQFPSIKVYDNYNEILHNIKIKNAIIATPTHTHYTIAKSFLLFGKNVLVEKPLTTSLKEAYELNKLALKNNVLLMTDYIYLYNPVVHRMKEIINKTNFGKIKYIDSTRINLGIYQNDSNVLWDLACHDISIINYLLDEKPTHIQAIAKKNGVLETEELSYIFLFFQSGMLVHINSSWASPVKMRKMIVGGEKKMMIFDDIDPVNKLTIFNYTESKLYSDKRELTQYRIGSGVSPIIENYEPLHKCIEEFLKCCVTDKTPISNFNDTVDIINYLEKANESLKKNSKIVEL